MDADSFIISAIYYLDTKEKIFNKLKIIPWLKKTMKYQNMSILDIKKIINSPKTLLEMKSKK
jgi:hypothetical protein